MNVATGKFIRPASIHGRAHLVVNELTGLLINRLKRPIYIEQMTDSDGTFYTHLEVHAPYRGRVDIIEPLEGEATLRLLVHGKEKFKAPFGRQNLRTISGLIRTECS